MKSKSRQDLVFTGAWIPGEVFFNPRLNLSEIKVWWVIYCICKGSPGGSFYKSNDYMAKLFHTDSRRVQERIKKLCREGYLRRKIFPERGNLRRIKLANGWKRKHKTYLRTFNFSVNKQKRKRLTLEKRVRSRGSERKLTRLDARPSNSKYTSIHDTNYKSISKDMDGKINFAVHKKIIQEKRQEGEIERVLLHWNGKGPPFVKHKWGAGTSIEKRIRALLRRELEEKQVTVIIRAIDVWHDFWFSPNLTLPKRSLYFYRQRLDDFIKPGQFARQEMIKLKVKPFSAYRRALKGHRYLQREFSRRDKYREVTAEIKDIWDRNFPNKFYDDNDFVYAARRWVEIVKEHPSLFKDKAGLELVIREGCGGKDSGFLTTKLFWEKIVTRLLKEYNYI